MDCSRCQHISAEALQKASSPAFTMGFFKEKGESRGIARSVEVFLVGLVNTL